MTISTTDDPRAGPFNGNGSQTAFPFAFKTFTKYDLLVVRADEDGLESVLVVDSDYSVALNADQNANPGGTVTYPISGTALPTGETLVIEGDTDFTQTTDITSGGGFYPEVIENALDRAVMLVKQLKVKVGRALQLAVSAPGGTDVTLPVPVANNMIGWDSAASALRNFDPSTLATVVAFAAWQSQKFSGNGAQTQFTLSSDPGNINNLDIAIGGVTQYPTTDYTLSGVVLTFTTAPPTGTDNILVRWGQALPQGTTPLEIALASTDSASDGAGLVGWHPARNYVYGTLGFKVADMISPSDYDADVTGAVDASAAFTSAISALTTRGGGVLYIRPGTYTFVTTTTFTLPSKTRVIAHGATLDFSGAAAASRIRAVGTIGSNIALTANVAVGDSVIPLTSVSGLAAGDILRLSSDDLVPLDDIGGSTTQQIGEFVTIRSISALNVTIDGYLDGAYLTADTAVVAKVTPAESITIEGLRILGFGISGADTSTLEVGISALYARDFVVRDCRVDFCDYNGIRVEQSYGFDIDHCTVNHGARASDAHTAVIQYGVAILGAASRGRVRHCEITGGKHGIAWSENNLPGIGRDVTLLDNTIVGTWHAGVSTHKSNQRFTITLNRIIGCARGMDIRVRNGIITKNHVRSIPGLSTIGDGISLSEDAGDLLIEGNEFDGVRFGIRGYNIGFSSGATPSNIKIRGNSFDAIDQYGIYLEQTQHATAMTGIVIEGNTIQEFGTDGLRLNGEFTGARVANNTFICASAPAGYGTRLMGTTKTRVSGNTYIGMVPVRLENDTQSVPVAPRNPLLIRNDWDHTTAFLSQVSASQVVQHSNIEIGDSSLTIAAGVITVPAGVGSITVDTEAAAASDDLDTINGGSTTDLMVFRAASGARTVVLKDGTGNLKLNGDFSLTSLDDSILLRNNGTGWSEVSRSDNTA